MPNDDLRIDVQVVINQAKSALKELKKELKDAGTAGVAANKRFVASSEIAIKNMQKMASGGGILPKDFDKNFKSATQQAQDYAGVIKARVIPASKMMGTAARGAIGKLDARLKSMKGEFQGWAMSIMFFGMALKRTFDTIWKSSTKTFNDVKSSVDGAFTGFQMLDGAVKFLGFSAGQALEPIAMFLIPIVQKIAQWVSENEKIFATAVLLLGVFGTFFTLLGGGVLAVAGFIAAWGPISTVAIPALVKLGGIIAGIGAGPFLIITAAVVAFIAMWQTNFGGIREFTKGIFGAIVTHAKNIFKGLGEILTGLWEVITGLFSGDFDQVIGGLQKVLIGALRIVASFGDLIFKLMMHIVVFIINIIKDLVFNMITLILGSVKNLVKVIDLIFGSDLADKMDSAISAVNRAKSNLTLTAPEQQGSLVDLVDVLAEKLQPNVTVNIDNAQVTDGITTQADRGI